MKPLLLLIAGLMLFAPVARAQVIINHAALDQLAGIAPVVATPVVAAPPVIRRLPRKVSYRRVLPRRIPKAPIVAPVASNQPIAKPAPLPKPEVQAVVAKPAMPLPAPPKPQALAPAIIDFAANGYDLPGNTAAMLKPFCGHTGVITIDAYAAANAADPSQAARLSMSRAFAIRDALTACGVPASNIIPRAAGSTNAKNPDAAEVSASP